MLSRLPPPMRTEAALYRGTLRHRRFGLRGHAFCYPLFMAWLDVDRIPELLSASRLTSHGGWNWAAFHEDDYFAGPGALRERLRRSAADAGVTLPGGPVFLLTHLRYLGYAFNPISLFYCEQAGGVPACVLALVSNTFGERHAYWLTAAERQAGLATPVYRHAKVMHVSPFLGMDQEYRFVLPPPGERLVVHMTVTESGAPAPTMDATLRLRAEPWNAATIRRALLRYPAMTAGVTLAIHWQALRLWLKRLPGYAHPERAA